MVKTTIDEFVNKAILKHNGRYDYSKVVYENTDSKVIIICGLHGDFEQRPTSHLKGIGCSKCAVNNRTSTNEEFIKKAILKHDGLYDYSKVIYKNCYSKVIITCKTHGEFDQKPNVHLNGSGCIKCVNGSRTSTNEEFIKKAILKHGNRYDYSKVAYKNNCSKVIITCKTHGEFEQIPNSHLNGSCCPKCAKNYSKLSLSWINYLQTTINKEIQNMFSPSGEYKVPKTRYKADGYCKETNTIYEFQGDIWHGNPKLCNKNDINPFSKKTYGELYKLTQIKKKKIIELGYNYVEMWEYDWKKSIKAIIKIQRIWRKKISNRRSP
jgi:hypothetical protein